MANIIVWNTNGDIDYSSEPYNFYIGRSKTMSSPLANPFTYNGKRSSLAKLSFKTREEALEAYELYFSKMYGTDEAFTNEFNRIYKAYRDGHDVYLQCFCKPLPCHGDILAKKLQEMLIREKRSEFYRKKEEKTEKINEIPDIKVEKEDIAEVKKEKNGLDWIF